MRPSCAFSAGTPIARKNKNFEELLKDPGMAQSLLQKLRIKSGDRIVVLNPPDGNILAREIPSSVVWGRQLRGTFRQIHCFVRSSSELKRIAPRAIPFLDSGGLLWIYFPKKTSGIQTDLSRDHGWEALSKARFSAVSLIGLDETWSGFAFRPSRREQRPGAALPSPEVEKYIDRARRTVKLPRDVRAALKRHRAASLRFETLSYTHRKEYIEWILGAKQKETRKRRTAIMVERLKQ
jgi:hypothetical protein